MNYILINILFIIKYISILNAYDNNITTTATSTIITENLDLNYTNQSSTTLLYDNNYNVNETTILITPTPTSTSINYNITKDIINGDKIQDLHQEQIEKINSLSCNISQLPSEYRVWKGNETNEMIIPKKSSDNNDTDIKNYTKDGLIWAGSIEIQSDDVLLVRIDDKLLINSNVNTNQSNDRVMYEPPTAVYQVTRNGYDNCDVIGGNLLDINPLKVDNQKLVTLYDKDLTEGINLLIVVSSLWGDQCIRLKVIVKSDNCGENKDCSGKGICYSTTSMEGYECQCCPGYIGSHCEELDACYKKPCKNNGICVDISQGNEGKTFQCLCPYGYTGKICAETSDPCASKPCQNGATCHGNVTEFICECPKGFCGHRCQHNLNECESSPCVHGICVDQENGYKCFCQPGFTGRHCEYEYNECISSPCLNGGTCTDHIGEFSCSCGRGFTGKRCEIKVDLCEPNPCPEPKYCMDRGNNYSCECPNKSDCSTPTRAACSTNPCINGGTCWSSMDSFYCACKPGFTGKICGDEFVVETITDSDQNSKGNELDLQVPISIRLDHVHNLYIAVGTLACAFVIVALIVTVCHCRVNNTYKNCLIDVRHYFKTKTNRVPEISQPVNSEWFSGKDKAPMATPSRSVPSLDTTDMYYTLDFSDSQSSPLIQ